jgi:alpha-tubulin suppressor-like RCC1 family protein/outer membrane protein assembly factor BamB
MKSRWSALNALCFCFALVLFSTLSGATAPSVVDLSEVPTRDEVWSFPTGGRILSSPAVSTDGSTVYFGSYDRNFYAVYTRDSGTKVGGDLKWQLPLRGRIISSPVIDTNGIIYVGCTDGRLYALGDNGHGSVSVLWSNRTARPITSSPAVGEDGTIYVGSQDNKLHAIFPDGATKWRFFSPHDVDTPLINSEGTIYFPSRGRLFGVTEEGAEAANHVLRRNIRSLPAIGTEDTLYFGTDGDIVFGLLAGGTTNVYRWRYDTDGDVVSSPAIDFSGRIYIGSATRFIYSFTTNGAARWRTKLPGVSRSAFSIDADGTVYVGCDDRRLYALHPDTGEVLWYFETGGHVRSSPAIDQFGMLYFGSSDGSLYAVETDVAVDNPEDPDPEVEPVWQMYRRDRQHTARAAVCEPFIVGELTGVTASETNFGSASVTSGSSVSIRVNARAGAVISYQWRFNGEDIELDADNVAPRSATNFVLTLPAVEPGDQGSYTVLVSTECGEVESDPFDLIVESAPFIVNALTNRHLLEGNTLVLESGITGSDPIRFQWYFNGVPISQAATLIITNVTVANQGSYWVTASNAFSGEILTTNGPITVFVYPNTLAVARFAVQPVAAGPQHSLAVLPDHTLWSWGLNSFGQLGNGISGSSGTDRITRNTPLLIGTNGAANTNAVWQSVTAGGRGHQPGTNQPAGFSLAIQTNGTLWAWGLNDRGQLGVGNTNVQRIPTRVGTASNWFQVEAGAAHVLALRRDGTLWAWGANSAGQLGNGSTNGSLEPVRIGTDSAWVEVRAGGHFSLARRADGTIWAWGTNNFGQLGVGNTAVQRAPVQVTNGVWTNMSAGVFHSLAVNGSGQVGAWGRNNQGQLGNGFSIYNSETGNEDSPILSSPGATRRVEAGHFHSFAIRADGTLWAWGANHHGQLGNGQRGSSVNTNDANSSVPVPIRPDLQWLSVDAANHSLGMTLDGRVWAWGWNNSGQVGNGTGGDGTSDHDRTEPVLLTFVSGTNVPPVTGTAPAISQQPASTNTVVQGGTANFTVGATGTGPLAYQWFFNSAPMSGATNVVVQIENAQRDNVGPYFAVVTNAFGAATSTVGYLVVTNTNGDVLTPTNPPGIVTQPESRTVQFGSNVSFSVVVTGAPPLAYQWFFNSNAIPALSNSTATNATLVLTNVSSSNAGPYFVVVTNSFGSVTSAVATLTTVSNISIPVITRQPTNQSGIVRGSHAVFDVEVSGTPPLRFQWFYNGNPIDGGTNSSARTDTLVLSNVQSGGIIRVSVSNDFGGTVSSNATLTVSNASPTPGSLMLPGELVLESIQIEDGVLRIEARAGEEQATLVLEASESLVQPNWRPVRTNEPGSRTFLLPLPESRARYYRLRRE